MCSPDSSEGILSPPGEYDWTCAAFGPPESTNQTENWSVQPFYTAHGRASLGTRGHVLSLIIAPLHGGSQLSLIHASLSQPQLIIQMASQSVQPFLHILRQCRYTLQWAHWRNLANTITSASFGPQPKWQIDRFSHFCTSTDAVYGRPM